MISTKKMDFLRVWEFKYEKQSEDLNIEISSVDIVTQIELVGLLLLAIFL